MFIFFSNLKDLIETTLLMDMLVPGAKEGTFTSSSYPGMQVQLQFWGSCHEVASPDAVQMMGEGCNK
jgi:hypothetical protein